MRFNSKESKIILLGTGNPNPDPIRFGPSLAIVVEDTSYLIDFGAGITRRTYEAYSNFGIKSLDSPRLTKGFLTHLHSDHTLGYPDLILTPWVMGRSKPLEIYGPQGTLEMTDNILKSYDVDIKERIDGLEPTNNLGYKVNVKEVKPGIIYEDKYTHFYGVKGFRGLSLGAKKFFMEPGGFCFFIGFAEQVIISPEHP